MTLVDGSEIGELFDPNACLYIPINAKLDIDNCMDSDNRMYNISTDALALSTMDDP